MKEKYLFIRKVTKYSTIIFLLFVTSQFLSCGNSNHVNQSPPQQNSPHEKSGAKLFKSNRTNLELRQDRIRFLNNTFIQSNITDRYFLNTKYTVYRNQPLSPAIFGYTASTDQVLFTVAFPDSFRVNLPEAIKAEISRHDIDHLDLFFTPQSYDGEGFKPHCWAAGDKLRAIPFAGTIYEGTLLVGVFESDQNIDRDILSGQVLPFGFSIHDNTLSPERPKLRIGAPPTHHPYVSFWSLVIDPAEKKAAATLHWIGDNDLNNEIRRILNAHHNRVLGNYGTLLAVIVDLNNFRHDKGTSVGFDLLQNSSLMEKLERLIR